MQEKQDGKGSIYFDVGNIRVTTLSKTWDGNLWIKIQTYKGDGNKLFQGAELPIPNKKIAFDLFASIHKTIEKNKKNC